MPAKSKTLPDYLVVSDTGNSTCVTLGIKRDRCVMTMTPFSVARRQYTPKKFDGSIGEKVRILPHYTWQGNNYTIGIETSEYRYGNPTERDTNNTARYGSPYHQFFVAVGTHKLGITSGKIALTVFMPPVPYMDTEKREKVRESFLNNGKVSFSYTNESGEAEGIDFEYIDCNVLPEGAAAIYGMILDKNGQPDSKGLAMIKAGYIALIDLGSYTANSLLLRNGQIDETSLDGSTIEELGVHHYIRKPLMNDYGVPNEVVDAAVVDFVKSGCNTNKPTVIRNDKGQSFDISEDIDQRRREYADAVRARIFNERFNGLRDLKGAILVGGGSMVIEDLLEGYGAVSIGKRIDDPHMINAESGLRRAMQENKLYPIDC